MKTVSLWVVLLAYGLALGGYAVWDNQKPAPETISPDPVILADYVKGKQWMRQARSVPYFLKREVSQDVLGQPRFPNKVLPPGATGTDLTLNSLGFTTAGACQGAGASLYSNATTILGMCTSGAAAWTINGANKDLSASNAGSTVSTSFFSSTAASGQNAFAATVNGARIDFGAGANDYANSDGTTVAYAGPVSSAQYFWGKTGFFNTVSGTMAISGTAPTISSGFGTSPSIVASNGSLAFQINVGTGGVATTGVIGLPAATNGWVCTCEDVTTQNTTVARTRQTGLGTTTTCPIGDFTSADVAGAWVASDKLTCIAVAY